jgi:acyl-CoA reductase-like NAD-dependent aldehyde dehydrogenase
MKTYRMYWDGEWREALDGATREAINPATGEAFARVAWGGREDARRAIAAANRAQPGWAATPLWERCERVEKIAGVIRNRVEELREILCEELGKPFHGEARDEASESHTNFLIAPQQAKYLEGSTYPVQTPDMRVMSFRRPRGVIGAITPWNFPSAIPTEYIPYALVMGNSVVWTPAPTAAATASVLAGLIVSAGTLPDGVFNLVTGPGAEVGDEIASSPHTHAIGMTGSPATAQIISARCGLKPRLFELGGNGPVVVLGDADPEAAAKAIAPACFYAAGQVCSSAERILVEENIREAFVAAMVEESKNWIIGDPRDEKVNVGPLNSAASLAKMRAHVEDALQKGARLRAGGRSPGTGGFFHEPTVLEGCSKDSLVNLEETFGPVAPVMSFKTTAEADTLIDACGLGLVSSVFTRDLDRAWAWAERLRTGLTVVNDFTNYWEYHLPFGGRAGTESGLGRIGGKSTLEFVSELHTLAFKVRNNL